MTIPLIQRPGPFQQLQQAVQSVMEQRQQRQAQQLSQMVGQAQLGQAQAQTERTQQLIGNNPQEQAYNQAQVAHLDAQGKLYKAQARALENPPPNRGQITTENFGILNSPQGGAPEAPAPQGAPTAPVQAGTPAPRVAQARRPVDPVRFSAYANLLAANPDMTAPAKARLWEMVDPSGTPPVDDERMTTFMRIWPATRNAGQAAMAAGMDGPPPGISPTQVHPSYSAAQVRIAQPRGNETFQQFLTRSQGSISQWAAPKPNALYAPEQPASADNSPTIPGMQPTEAITLAYRLFVSAQQQLVPRAVPSSTPEAIARVGMRYKTQLEQRGLDPADVEQVLRNRGYLR